MIHRRRLLAAAPALALAPAALAQVGGATRIPPIGAGDIPIGSTSARVQVIEYASFACPHCAEWSARVWPAFKAAYIDTGLVRFALREVVTEPAPVSAAGAMLARCAAPDRYYEAAAYLFTAQGQLAGAERPFDVYAGVGSLFGLSVPRVNACLRDQAGFQALNRRVAGAASAGIDHTPTFVINGRPIGHDHSLAALAAAIDPLLTPAERARLAAARA